MNHESTAARVAMRCRAGRRASLAAFACALAALPCPAFAYVGPGAGLSALGIVIGLIAAVLLGIVGFVWYPIKRLLRLRRERNAAPQEGSGPGEPPAKEP